MKKPGKTPPTFSAREWVPLTDAFLQILSIVGRRDLALSCINRDLRSGKLKSALVKVSPDGGVTMTLLKLSDWEQRAVWTPLNPQEGVGVEPYVDGHVYLRRIDLDKHYSIAATLAAHQSNDTPSILTTGKVGARRKPGPKIRHDWRLHVAAEVHRIKETGKATPSAAELAQFCYNKWKWQPDESDIQKLLKYLLTE
jgi:hypothetical protein